jgi:hypothetical protein
MYYNSAFFVKRPPRKKCFFRQAGEWDYFFPQIITGETRLPGVGFVEVWAHETQNSLQELWCLVQVRIFSPQGEISSFSSVYDAFTSHFVRCLARIGSEWSSLTF